MCGEKMGERNSLNLKQYSQEEEYFRYDIKSQLTKIPKTKQGFQ